MERFAFVAQARPLEKLALKAASIGSRGGELGTSQGISSTCAQI